MPLPFVFLHKSLPEWQNQGFFVNGRDGWRTSCYSQLMDIRFYLGKAEGEALARAVAASQNRDALWMVAGTAAVFGLSLALPLSASPEGLMRLGLSVAIAMLGGILGYAAAWKWRRLRLDWAPAPQLAGLEPGSRTVSLSLNSIRDLGPLGERVFRWRAFLGEVQTQDWIAFVVSGREAVALPKSALDERGLAEAEMLARLIGRGGT